MSALHKGGAGELHLNEPREETILKTFYPVLAYQNKNEITHHIAFE